MVTSKTHNIGPGELIGGSLISVNEQGGESERDPLKYIAPYPLPIFFISAISSGKSVLCPAAWELIPTTCTSASTACCATSLGVWDEKKIRLLTKKANISQHTKTNYSWDGSKKINCPGEQRVSNMTGSVPGRYDFGEEESFTSGLMWYEAKASLVL